MPNSPCAALATHFTNCTGIGSFSPRRSRNASRCAVVVSWPTMLLIGSPTNWNSENEMKATTSITRIAWSSRCTTNASISLAPRVAGRGRTGQLADSPSRAILLQDDGAQVDVVERPLDHGFHRVAAHAPGQRLLVQRNVADLVLVDLESLADELVALVLVDLDRDQIGQLLDPGLEYRPEFQVPWASPSMVVMFWSMLWAS